MLAFIGGTGLTRMPGLAIQQTRLIDTPWGAPASAVSQGVFQGREVLFLARHGDPHRLLPHQVNYRANIWALREAGATAIVAVNAVGGITPAMQSKTLVVPDQIIDYSWGRESTFFDEPSGEVVHVDFSWPFDTGLRQRLLQAADKAQVPVIEGGCYGVTQGPRLETAAEIVRMEKEGCDIVGMTGMPEAVLARELALPYAMLSLVVNPAAGKATTEITMAQIEEAIHAGMQDAHAVLAQLAQGD